MRLPVFSRHNLVMAVLILPPLLIISSAVLVVRASFVTGRSSTYWTGMSLLYVGCLQSLFIGLRFNRSLSDWMIRRGISGRRERPRPPLWMLLVFIALLAPLFALRAQERRQSDRENQAFRATQRAFQAEQIALCTKMERDCLAAAREQEQLGAECRAKDARGESWKGTNWADTAKFHESEAAFWRQQAAGSVTLRKQVEQLAW